MRSGIRTWARGAGVALLAVAAAAPVAGATPADTSAQPGMIDIADLPPDSLPWMGGAYDEPGWNITGPCFWQYNTNDIPVESVWSAGFNTSETASVYEHAVVLPTEAEAVALAWSVRQHYEGCVDRTRAGNTGDIVTGYDHGSIAVEEGATAGGVHIAYVPYWQGYRNYLYGVGRDGNTVVLVEWESNWTQPDVPAFKETVKAAVNKLY
ncbi:hypothetical protein ACFVYP_34270 [Kitasatospora sp. NPDC058201]|uniref:hypothetical protein n=1 Tax=unclassified Kitasatospora TaxID=2633591 RepID=UPI00364A2D0D